MVRISFGFRLCNQMRIHYPCRLSVRKARYIFFVAEGFLLLFPLLFLLLLLVVIIIIISIIVILSLHPA